MFNFFKKKRQEVPQKQASNSVKNSALQKNIEELTCIFCGESFKPSELIFGINAVESDIDVDRVYENFITKTYMIGNKETRVRRKYLENWKNDDVKVTAWEEGFDGVVPLTAEGIFRAKQFQEDQPDKAEESLLDLGLGSLSNEMGSMPITAVRSEYRDHAQKTVAEYRLCPHCHCQLPEGFANRKIVSVGLYGGKRSGKTTYMAMVVKKLENELNKLMLGDAEVVIESKDPLETWYKSARDEKGQIATATGLPPFPVILSISPHNELYPPFFLKIQDIPGELADQKRADSLAGHPFTKADAFIAIVDINMFVATSDRKGIAEREAECKQYSAEIERYKKQKERIEEDIEEGDIVEINTRIAALDKRKREAQKEQETLQYRINSDNWNSIYGNLAFTRNMNNLKSVQVVFTKMDRWLCLDEASNDKKTNDLRTDLSVCSEIITDQTKTHTESINLNHLILAHNQILKLLTRDATLASEIEKEITIGEGKKKKKIKKVETTSLLDWIAEQKIGFKQKEKTAYCAVSSRQSDVAGNENAFQDSMNILDPIFNVCRWQNLLPVKKK